MVLTEENATTLKVALERANLLRDDLYILQWVDVLSRGWTSLAPLVGQALTQLGAKLLVVDTLPQFAPEAEKDSESGQNCGSRIFGIFAQTARVNARVAFR